MSRDPSSAAIQPGPAAPPRARGIRSLAHRRPGQDGLPDEGRLPSFDRATGWTGSPPLDRAALRGRVVLVDFWTYTCVNWLRTAPYLRAWHAKYARAGLTVVDVHTPEFDFEHDAGNVAEAIGRLGIEYPVATDDGYGVWNDFANAYWPALYLADHEGRIRFHHFGEGEYARIEMAVQQLLAEAGAEDLDVDLVGVDPHGLEVPADWATLRSPETYLGYARSVGFVSDDPRRYDRASVYETPPGMPVGAWGLEGAWTVTSRAAVVDESGASVSIAFHARDVNLVMAPVRRGASVPFRVVLGGRAPGAAHGDDVDEAGHGVLHDQTTYQLIRQPGPVQDDVVTIEFLRSGAAAYCCTFG